LFYKLLLDVFLEDADLSFCLSTGFFFVELLGDLVLGFFDISVEFSFDFFVDQLCFFFEPISLFMGLCVWFCRPTNYVPRSFFSNSAIYAFACALSSLLI
jgi:hypothetical protein